MPKFKLFTTFDFDQESYIDEVNDNLIQGLSEFSDSESSKVVIPQEKFEYEVPISVDLDKVISYVATYRSHIDTLGQYTSVLLSNGTWLLLNIEFDEFHKIIK